MEFQFYTDSLKDVDILSVDGIAPKGLNLSHWPGNRTPKEYKADTSTEICLNFVQSQTYLEELSKFKIISNNHYDTDGFLSLASIIQPELSLQYKKHIINTAITGDFRRYTTDGALKLDLTVTNLSSGENSPLTDKVKVLSNEAKRQMQYEYLLSHYKQLLQDINHFKGLWEKDFNTIKKDLKAEEKILDLKYDKELDLSVIILKETIHEIALKSICKGNHILKIIKSKKGYHYDFQYTVESWFDLVNPPTILRKNFNPMIIDFEKLDPEISWQADDISSPVPHFQSIIDDKLLFSKIITPEVFINLLRQFLS